MSNQPQLLSGVILDKYLQTAFDCGVADREAGKPPNLEIMNDENVWIVEAYREGYEWGERQ